MEGIKTAPTDDRQLHRSSYDEVGLNPFESLSAGFWKSDASGKPVTFGNHNFSRLDRKSASGVQFLTSPSLYCLSAGIRGVPPHLLTWC